MQAADDLIDEREAVALVRPEGQEGDRLGGIGRRVAVAIDAAIGGSGLTLALELLDAAHRDDARWPSR